MYGFIVQKHEEKSLGTTTGFLSSKIEDFLEFYYLILLTVFSSSRVVSSLFDLLLLVEIFLVKKQVNTCPKSTLYACKMCFSQKQVLAVVNLR